MRRARDPSRCCRTLEAPFRLSSGGSTDDHSPSRVSTLRVGCLVSIGYDVGVAMDDLQLDQSLQGVDSFRVKRRSRSRERRASPPSRLSPKLHMVEWERRPGTTRGRTEASLEFVSTPECSSTPEHSEGEILVERLPRTHTHVQQSAHRVSLQRNEGVTRNCLGQ